MSAQKSSGPALAGWPQLPQVNLLPPEFLEARSLVRVKRVLALVVVAVLVAAIGLVAVSKLQANKAEEALQKAQNDSASLSAEIATYGDVTATLAQLSRAKLAQVVAMSTDVLWADRLQALNAVLPSSTSYEIYTVESSTPMTRLAAATDVLAPLALAHVTIQARLTAPPDIPAILDALQSVPAVQDVRVSSVVVAGDDETPQYWKLTGDVNFSDEAASHRFDQTEDAK